MLKRLTIITAGVLLLFCAFIPKAVESSAPAAETLTADTREYAERVNGGGAFCFLGQREITSSMPVVIEKFSVSPGDEINVGDEIAAVDRKSTAALVESLGQVSMLAVPASNLETAIALIPEKITSDCAGKIISTAPEGLAIQSGSSIASVTKSEDFAAVVAVSELDISKVKIGQKAEIKAAAYEDEVFPATVTSIAETARNQYNGAVLETVVDVVVTPDESDERLKPGLSADAEIFLEAPRQISVVPYCAIGQDDGGEYVCVYEDGKAVRKYITTGAEFEDGAEVVYLPSGAVIFKNPEEVIDKKYIKIIQ